MQLGRQRFLFVLTIGVLVRCLLPSTATIYSIWWPSTSVSAQQNRSELSFQTREEAYRANNLGVAFLEQFDYKSAVDSFRRALVIDPQLALAQTNLALGLYNLQDYDNAARAAEKAARMSPDSAQPLYILGLIARGRNNTDEAVADFKRVLAIGPDDVGANVSLGQITCRKTSSRSNRVVPGSRPRRAVQLDRAVQSGNCAVAERQP